MDKKWIATIASIAFFVGFFFHWLQNLEAVISVHDGMLKQIKDSQQASKGCEQANKAMKVFLSTK